MATKVKDVYSVLAEYAPPEMKMDFDNVGFLVGFSDNEVKRIIVSLDITDDVIEEAARDGAELIVSHHPLFFSLKSVTDSDLIGRKITRLLSKNMSAICMHTNLDAARGGVNDALAAAAGLENVQLLSADGYLGGEPFSYGRYGYLPQKTDLVSYLAYLTKRLEANGLRYHDAGRDVSKVAVVGGSGGSELKKAFEIGCDTLITADVKYNVFLDAKEYGVNLIDADHFCTENVVTPILKKLLSEQFPNVSVSISKRHAQTAKFVI